jgi:hypothetical protein
MHPVVKLKVAHIELRLVNVVMKGVPLGLIDPVMKGQLGVEPGDGIEPLPLICVIKGLSEIKVLKVLRGRRFCR